MADEPSSTSNDQTPEPPAPEVLKPQTDNQSEDTPPAAEVATKTAVPAAALARRRTTYRPSHKATFVGLAVVVAILAINAGIIFFVIKKQAKTDTQANQEQVTISAEALDQVGVNRSVVGGSGIELTVNPDARFAGKVQIGGDVSVAGQLKLNSKFSATDASLAKLDAGDTSLNQLNVNGDATASTLNLRRDLSVAGTTRFQGDVVLTRLLTVNNSANVAGNLAVGGSLSVGNFQTRSLVSDTTITLGGHFITRGSAPNVGPGPALGANGTVSISGSDTAGTVAANVGTGSGGGVLANIAFRQQYSSTPRVVVTAVGAGLGSVYVSRTSGGFSIGVNGSIPPGGYAFDYIVVQ